MAGQECHTIDALSDMACKKSVVPVFDANFAMKALRPRQEKSLHPARQFSGPFSQLLVNFRLNFARGRKGSVVDPKQGKRAILAAETRTAVVVAAWAENGVKMGVDKGTGPGPLHSRCSSDLGSRAAALECLVN